MITIYRGGNRKVRIRLNKSRDEVVDLSDMRLYVELTGRISYRIAHTIQENSILLEIPKFVHDGLYGINVVFILQEKPLVVAGREDYIMISEFADEASCQDPNEIPVISLIAQADVPTVRINTTFRQGETFNVEMAISFEGAEHEAEDFTVEIADPFGKTQEKPFCMDGGSIYMDFQGVETEKMPIGHYDVTLWYHKGGDNQMLLEFPKAFRIVKRLNQ